MDRSLLLLPLLLICACGEPGTDPETSTGTATEEVERSTGKMIDLSAHDVPLAVQVDQQLVGADTTIITWNETFGRLEVAAGERFQITITEEEADLARLKADLDRDMLRKNTIIEEAPGLVIYRSEFPDETITFVHFYRIVQHDGRTFVVQSNDQGRFNEADVRRMAASVMPLQNA